MAELGQFLIDEKPDIVALNEVKLNKEQGNLRLEFPGFTTLHYPRPKNPGKGGGVALLLREEVSFTEVHAFDKMQLEVSAVEIQSSSGSILIAALYNPPDKEISRIFLDTVTLDFENWLIVGDLNSKHHLFGCRGVTNKSGKILAEWQESGGGVILGNKLPTRFMFPDQLELLDLMIFSAGLANKCSSFDVLYDSLLHSDHYPIRAEFDFVIPNWQTKQVTKSFDFNRANWPLFKSCLANSQIDLSIEDIDLLNEKITEQINLAASESIPFRNFKPFGKTLPKEILVLLSERRAAKKKAKKTKGEEDMKEFNRLSRTVRNEILKHRNEVWLKFLEKIGSNHVSSVPFWRRVNSARSSKKKRKMSNFFYNGTRYETNKDKAGLFRGLMHSRFAKTDNPNFSESFKLKVEAALKEYLGKNADFKIDEEVNMAELQKAIHKLKSKSCPGKDGIFNIFLKNLPLSFLQHLLWLCNLSLKQGKLPVTWKIASITMIPKGQKSAADPANYRPISLISCLGKLIERIVAARLSKFLDENKIIIRQQSGFRSGRRTSDNLIFLSQKVAEAFERKKKIVSFFFDIQGAFDTVWHDGLVYKLIELKIPAYIIYWVRAFLSKRFFQVKVDDEFSALAPIGAGVPQGSAISPILFSIFINDVPANSLENDSFTLLFADDLNTFFIFRSVNTELKNKIGRYMTKVEEWLCNWRLCMAPSKCQYTVFTKSGEQDIFGIELFGVKIPYEANPVSLGITFDRSLNFESHIKKIEEKCHDRLNIIKILSHRSWSLTPATLVAIYKSLIGSVIDYAFFVQSQLSEKGTKKVQKIQNSAMRVIFKQKYDCPSVTLCSLASLPRVSERMDDLFGRFLDAALASSNELILNLCWGYRRSFQARGTSHPTLLCQYREQIDSVVFVNESQTFS